MIAAPERRRGPLACGTDVVSIDRIRDLIDRFGDSFLDRVYAETETEYCRSRADPAQHFAARWAAKEAAIKALPDAEPAIVPADVVVERDEGAPELAFRGRAEERLATLDGVETTLSLSHDRTAGVATAYVVLSTGTPPVETEGEP